MRGNYSEENEDENAPTVSRVCAGEFLHDNMEALAKLVQDTGAGIVLSSTWRLDVADIAAVNSQLAAAAIPACIDTTGKDADNSRANEVLHFMKEKRGKDVPFVILDDQPILDQRCEPAVKEALRHHFVHVNATEGLTDADAEKARAILLSKCATLRATVD